MNGKVLGLDDNFFKRGDSYQGAQGGVIDLDYENVGAPPLHPNCRCTLTPIVTDGRSMPAKDTSLEHEIDSLLEKSSTLPTDESKN